VGASRPDVCDDEWITVKTKPRWTRASLWISLQAVVWIAVDQASKWWAESTLPFGQYQPLLGELFGLRLVYNPGAAFGLAAEHTWVLSIVAAVAVVGLAWFSLRPHHWAWTLGLGALLGGAVSHLFDRLFREPGFATGHIVDFLDYAGFFVGNVADIALVGGAGVLILASLLAPADPAEGERPAESTESK
jgi:signal peptidase II